MDDSGDNIETVSSQIHNNDSTNWEELDGYIVLDEDIQNKYEDDVKGDDVNDMEIDSQINTKNCSYIAKGIEFKSIEEARMTYLAYAKCKGFGIRKYSSVKSVANPSLVIGKSFVCDKQGKKLPRKKEEGRAIKRRRETRTDCKARMRINLDQLNGLWRVSIFDDVHNHALTTPSKIGNIRSHKQYHRTPTVRNLVSILHDEGVPNCEITRFVNATSGSEDLTITNQQCHYYLRTERENYIGRECMFVIMQFQEKMKNDSMFWFAMDVDSETHRLKSIFWADGRSRATYQEFSDVIVFDVTYRTNKWEMPFAPFTGVNHHRQSTLFGCALIIDETEKTFVWLFNEWLKCMFNVTPKEIIIDQDTAICAAIKKVFPDTRHRYCSWHVNKHATEHLALIHPSNVEFANDYYKWYNSESILESEQNWDLLTRKYSKEKLKWLLKMYEKRINWVLVYLNDVFTAGMTSSQRSESINSFFDGYVHAATLLNEFTIQYDKALKARRRSEKSEDFATTNSKPECESRMEVQEQAARSYTRKMYNVFYEQFVASQAYCKEKITKENSRTQYIVGMRNIDKSKWRTVIHDFSFGEKFNCSCAMFETSGMLCKHILAIFRMKRIPLIPNQYILRRWTMDARYCVSGDTSMVSSEVLRTVQVTPLQTLLLEAKHKKYMKYVSASAFECKLYDSWLNTRLLKLSVKDSDNHIDSN